MTKKVLLLAPMLALGSLAIGQANLWHLGGSYMDANSGLASPGPSTSGSMQRYLYEDDASSFAVPGLCETYCNLSWGTTGRANYIVINHITEGYSPALPGFAAGRKTISSGVGTVYSDNGSYAAGQLQSDGKRPLYARNGNTIYRLCYMDGDGNTSGSPTLLHTAPGPSGFEFDNWIAMEVSSDGKFLLMVGKDAKSLVALNLTTLTTFVYNAPGGVHGRIQGFEYVQISPMVPIRIYLSYSTKNAANPGGTGGVGFYTLMDPATFYSVAPPAGTTATEFGFSEIERAKNGKLYLARNASGNYDFSAGGTVYSLDIFDNWTATPFAVPASDNTTWGAACDKYYIQTQIDGENYDAGYYAAPSVVAGSVTVKLISGSTSAATAPTVYRCGSESLVLTALTTGLVKEYDYEVDAGPSTGPMPGYIHTTGTVTTSANKFELLMGTILPADFMATEWKVKLTPKSACSTSGNASTTYFKIKQADELSRFKKATNTGSGSAAIQTSPVITTPAPAINSSIGIFRGNIDAAQGWVGASTAGIIEVEAKGNWSMRVYEVDPATGLRMVRSGITAPTVVQRSGTGNLPAYTRFTDYSKAFKASNPPFYDDAATAYGDGTYFVDYYKESFNNGTLTEYSSRVYCAELEVFEPTSSCTSLTRSFFRVANNGPYVNGANARTAGIDESDDAAVSIYPNPASAKVTVSIPSQTVKAALVLMDNAGRKVYESNSLQAGETTINIQHLPSGIYFYEISLDGKLEHGKLIKQ